MKKRYTWTEEQIRYIKRIAKGNKKKTILEKVNKKFNLTLNINQLNNCMNNRGIKTKIRHTWTNEQIEYLKSIAKGTPRKVIADKINKKFNLNLSMQQLRDCMNGRGIRNNIDKRFSAESGGNRCQQEKPIGTVSKWECGYARIKTGDNEWEFIQRYVWKKHHGEIPPGHSVIFLDGNTDNYNIENLALVDRNELMKYNSMRLNSNNQELNRVAVNLAKLMTKAKEKGEVYE